MIENLELLDHLPEAIRGERFRIETPSHINDDMWPTDHVLLLEELIYPLCQFADSAMVKERLEAALKECSVDPLGLYCAHTCFYVQVLNESANGSPLKIDRETLPKFLAIKLKELEPQLRTWVHPRYKDPGDALRVTISGMKILKRDHGIRFE